MSHPDLRVIDRAIELIETRARHFSCAAIGAAVDELYFPALFGEDSSRERDDVVRAYLRQYRMWARRRGTPAWWDSIRRYKRERIAALKSFRQACIDAAAREKRAC